MGLAQGSETRIAPILTDLKSCRIQTERSAWIALHGGEHFADGGFDSDEHSAADQAVADVQFHEVGNEVDQLQVFHRESVASIDLKAGFVGAGGGLNESLDLFIPRRLLMI